MYSIYWLISEDRKKSCVGFTENIINRIKKHRNREVQSTVNFGRFRRIVLERVTNIKEARIREKYWKSCAGRKN